MKKSIFIFFMFFLLAGCAETKISINKNINRINLAVDDKFKIANIIKDVSIDWTSSNPEVVIIENEYIIALSAGQSIITANYNNEEIVYLINVESYVNKITISGKENLVLNEEYLYNVEVIGNSLNKEVYWESSDNNIIEVNQDGLVKALNSGMARIIVTAKTDKKIKTEFHVVVEEVFNYDEIDRLINNIIINKEVINVNDYDFLGNVANRTINSVVGVSSYNNNISINTGTGLVYKSEVIPGIENLNDSSILYKYFVITNELILRNANQAKIYLNNEYHNSEIIAKDPKSGLAVLMFISNYYIPIAKFSEDSINKGEIVLSIGNSNDIEYVQSLSVGIISNIERYLVYDTNGDNINDWGMKFIQHDTAITNDSYGGPIINLKGEVIAINSRKIVSYDIEGMNFAIPIKDVKTIIAILETGNVPQRVQLGVTGLDVDTIVKNPNTYPNEYVYGYKYGFYVSTVIEGSMAEIAGIKQGDIILKYNGVDLINTFNIRDEINKYLLGSGEVVIVTIIRQGHEIQLEIVY